MKNKLNDLVQLVWVPWSWKSYILWQIRNSLIWVFNFIEFWQLLKEKIKKKWLDLTDWYMPSVQDVYWTIDDVIKQSPAIFTSHLVHFNWSEYFINKDLELYTRSRLYISIISDPEIIENRRLKDIKDWRRYRYSTSREQIIEHINKTLEATKMIVEELWSSHIIINNNDNDVDKVIWELLNFLLDF